MLTLKQKRNISRIVKQGLAYHHDTLAERWALRQHINAMTEGGMIAICRSGMDCDCTQYSSVRIVPAPVSVFAFLREEDEHERWLDGPESMWIERPSDHGGENHYASSDRALAAYEDGHPAYVTWGDL